jgi:integrase/recombinase XerD
MQLKQASTDFLVGYFSTHDHSAKTKAAYTSDLAQFLHFAGGETNLTQINATSIESWAGQLKQDGYFPASIRRKIVVLKVFFAYWMRKQVLTESPFWRVKLSLGRIHQLPRTLTGQEILALLLEAGRKARTQSGDKLELMHIYGSADSSYRAIRNLALLDLLFATGMRVGEASGLNVPDFCTEEAIFSVHGKGGRNRLAYIADEHSLRIQQDHFKVRKQIQTQCPALFLNQSGKRLSTQGITNVIAQLRCQVGIERHITPHMLRHTVATLLLRNGVDIRIVQEFLGHSSIVTTQRYTHICKEHMFSVLRKDHPSINLRQRAHWRPSQEASSTAATAFDPAML